MSLPNSYEVGRPVNNTTQRSEDYKAFPMVIPSSWDPLKKDWKKNKLLQLKEIVTQATERGLLQQLVNAATTQDEILTEPWDETNENKLIRENKKNEILSVLANQAKIQNQVEDTIISKRKAERAERILQENFKPLIQFPGNLDEFVKDEYGFYGPKINSEILEQMYTTLEALKFPKTQINGLKSAIKNLPAPNGEGRIPTATEIEQMRKIKHKLEVLEISAETILGKDQTNAPELQILREQVFPSFIRILDDIINFKELNQAFLDERAAVLSPSGIQNFGSVLKPYMPDNTLQLAAEEDPEGYAEELTHQKEDEALATDESDTGYAPLVRSGVNPPPLRRPIDVSNATEVNKEIERRRASTAAATQSGLTPGALASATPIAARASVLNPESGKMIYVGSIEYDKLKKRYKQLPDGSFTYTPQEVETNMQKDEIERKKTIARALLAEERENLDKEIRAKIQNPQLRNVAQEEKAPSARKEGRGENEVPERIVVRAVKKKRGADYKVSPEGKFGDLEIDMKQFRAHKLKAKKGKKVVMQQVMSPGLRLLMTKRFNRSFPYTEEDFKDYATISQLAELPIRDHNYSLKSQIIAGSLKPTKRDKSTKLVYYNDPKELTDRLHIILGSIDAGNNAPSLKEEASQIMDILKGKGIITPTEVETILDSML